MCKKQFIRQAFFLVWALLSGFHASADVKTAYQQYKAGRYAAALQQALPDAGKGDPRASELVGYLYLKGQGTPQNYALAYKYLLQAAEAGQGSAQANLGLMLNNGWGKEKSPTQAFKFFDQAAKKGNSFAQVEAAKMLLQGLGTEKDTEKGVEYLRKAAASNSHQAELLIALLIQQKTIDEEQPLQALQLLQSAAEKGNADAQFHLGHFYADKNNDLGKLDINKSVSHFKKAAEGGVIEAALPLYFIYAGFLGTPPNPALATYWMQEFQESQLSTKDKILRHWVGSVDINDFKDEVRLGKRLKSQSDSGQAQSAHNLAMIYFHGFNQIKPNRTLAAALMKKSVDAGQVESMVMLAKWQLADVEGTDSDPFVAKELLENAAQGGSVDALFELGKFYFDFLDNPATGLDYIRQAANQKHLAAQIFVDVAARTSPKPAMQLEK
ncbi:MAG: tetratricopeptide repeat protein [Rhodoferax sp.]